MTTTKKKAASTSTTVDVGTSVTMGTNHEAGVAPIVMPVSSTPPSTAVPAYIPQCLALLAQLAAIIPEGDALTALDKKRQAKARKGSEQYIPQLVSLAKQFGVSLKLVPTDGIEQNAVEAQALVPVLKQIGVLTKKVNDRTFSTRADSWGGSSKLYVVLRRLAKDNGDLAEGLAPVEAFFNHRHPTVAKDHPKTKKGKAALAAQKAAAEGVTVSVAPAGGGEAGAAPAVATPGVAVPAVAASSAVPVTAATEAPVATPVNGSNGSNENGVAHA